MSEAKDHASTINRVVAELKSAGVGVLDAKGDFRRALNEAASKSGIDRAEIRTERRRALNEAAALIGGK